MNWLLQYADYVDRHFGRIFFLFLQHVQVVLLSVAIAALISLALAIATEHIPWLRSAILSITGTILTIPSFALFGLMIPLFGLGVAPAVLALTLYAIFPILRNAVTGLDTVDRGVLDAARGMGMSDRSRLFRIRLPLAWPVILNGIRVATIMTVAIAAIGAAVRGPGLGELILRGLSRTGGANALNEALTGVIGVVIVAAVLDLGILIISKLTTPRGLHA